MLISPSATLGNRPAMVGNGKVTPRNRYVALSNDKTMPGNGRLMLSRQYLRPAKAIECFANRVKPHPMVNFDQV